MTTLKDIKKAVNTALKELYPYNKIYGADTVEGYEKPSFFVYVTQTFSESTANYTHKNVEIEVDYIQKEPDESDAMDFFAKVEDRFRTKLKVEDRLLNTSELYSGFIGDNTNIPTFTFNVEFFDFYRKEENVAMMEDVQIKQEV